MIDSTCATSWFSIGLLVFSFTLAANDGKHRCLCSRVSTRIRTTHSSAVVFFNKRERKVQLFWNTIPVMSNQKAWMPLESLPSNEKMVDCKSLINKLLVKRTTTCRLWNIPCCDAPAIVIFIGIRNRCYICLVSTLRYICKFDINSRSNPLMSNDKRKQDVALGVPLLCLSITLPDWLNYIYCDKVELEILVNWTVEMWF